MCNHISFYNERMGSKADENRGFDRGWSWTASHDEHTNLFSVDLILFCPTTQQSVKSLKAQAGHQSICIQTVQFHAVC